MGREGGGESRAGKEEEGGEVGLCNLHVVPPGNLDNVQSQCRDADLIT
jgi:hypothetical protein